MTAATLADLFQRMYDDRLSIAKQAAAIVDFQQALPEGLAEPAQMRALGPVLLTSPNACSHLNLIWGHLRRAETEGDHRPLLPGVLKAWSRQALTPLRWGLLNQALADVYDASFQEQALDRILPTLPTTAPDGQPVANRVLQGLVRSNSELPHWHAWRSAYRVEGNPPGANLAEALLQQSVRFGTDAEPAIGWGRILPMATPVEWGQALVRAWSNPNAHPRLAALWQQGPWPLRAPAIEAEAWWGTLDALAATDSASLSLRLAALDALTLQFGADWAATPHSAGPRSARYRDQQLAQRPASPPRARPRS